MRATLILGLAPAPGTLGALTSGALTFVPIGLATGCDSDPDQSKEYVQTLRPLLLENSAVASKVLEQAATIYNHKRDKKDPPLDDIIVRWETEVIPLAAHLHHQARLTEAPQAWTQEHADLVDIWGARAASYRLLSESMRTGDLKGWDSARGQIIAVTNKESDWFDKLQARAGFPVEAYP